MTAGESCGALEAYEALLTIYTFISLYKVGRIT